jgi:hypothetical protein
MIYVILPAAVELKRQQKRPVDARTEARTYGADVAAAGLSRMPGREKPCGRIPLPAPEVGTTSHLGQPSA